MPQLKTSSKWVRETSRSPLRKRVFDGATDIGYIEYNVVTDPRGSKDCYHHAVLTDVVGGVVVGHLHPNMQGALDALTRYLTPARAA